MRGTTQIIQKQIILALKHIETLGGWGIHHSKKHPSVPHRNDSDSPWDFAMLLSRRRLPHRPRCASDLVRRVPGGSGPCSERGCTSCASRDAKGRTFFSKSVGTKRIQTEGIRCYETLDLSLLKLAQWWRDSTLVDGLSRAHPGALRLPR